MNEKPTESELNSILNGNDPLEIETQPDGSIRAVPKGTAVNAEPNVLTIEEASLLFNEGASLDDIDMEVHRDPKLEANMNAVGGGLKAAAEYNLEAEVVFFALQYAQHNPEASIEDCMNYGVSEWIK